MSTKQLSTSPAREVENITPNDSTDLTFVPRGLSWAGTGDIAIITEAGNSRTITSLGTSIIHPISPKRILSTGTTATGIQAWL